MAKHRLHLHKREQSAVEKADPLAPMLAHVAAQRADDCAHGPVWFAPGQPRQSVPAPDRARTSHKARLVASVDAAHSARARSRVAQYQKRSERAMREARRERPPVNPFLA